VLRELHGRLAKAYGYPFVLDLGGVLDDREAMLAILREAAEDPAYGGDRRAIIFLMETADALGDADRAAQWADWCRRLSTPMVWLFRRPVLARIGDGNIGDPDGTVDLMVRIEFDDALTVALDQVDVRLDGA